jgi:hypothetical protein
MTDAGGAAPDDVAATVAADLKDAFAAVIAAPIDADEKGRWHQRLLAVTNMSKHDVARAHEQLIRFNDAWNARVRGKDEREEGTDR